MKNNIKDIINDDFKLESERLILRRLTLYDAEDIFEYASDPQIDKYVPWEHNKSIDMTITFLKEEIAHYKEMNTFAFGLEHKENHKIIGIVNVGRWDKECDWIEIGYTISREYWNQGITTEASKTLIEFIFKEMEVNRIEAVCIVDNKASERVMQKLGMTYEGILRKRLFSNGNYYDAKMYSILKNEYYKKKLN